MVWATWAAVTTQLLVYHRHGRVLIHVRGLALADRAPVPPNLQGTNPIPDFMAIVSRQTIGAGGEAGPRAGEASGQMPRETWARA